MAHWQSYLDTHRDRFLNELLAFLRIPSVSALPEHVPDVQRAAEWTAARLESAGLENVRVLPTEGRPAVYGDWLHAPGKPTILIYGHFDTQPADPISQWTHPPFEPTVRNNRVYARGASDDKGNLLLPVFAVEALLHANNGLPVNVKFLLEGEEEIGSRNLPALIETRNDLFACDLAVSADGTQWTEDHPGLLIGFKGACGVQIDLTGPASDLHSGIYGGTVQTPFMPLPASWTPCAARKATSA